MPGLPVTDGRIILVIVALICAGVFLNGLRFSQMDRNPWAGKSVFGMPVQGADMPVSRVNLIGRVQMIFAPLFFLLFAAICLGLFGSVDGIKTISLN